MPCPPIRPPSLKEPGGKPAPQVRPAENWQYLTNEMKLPPGLIVFLYRRRWDLEKVYDEFKNKLNEKKSWASGVTAKAAQAAFLCLLHNLMVLFEAGLAEAGITHKAETERREKILTKRTERVEKTGRKMPLIIAGFQRLTHRTVKSIRWLRSFFWQNRPLDDLRLILKKRYSALWAQFENRSFSNFVASYMVFS